MPQDNQPTSGGDVSGDADVRFRTLFDQAPFSMQLLSVDGRTIQVNRAWEALWQVSDGDGVKEYLLNEYNVLTDPQLEAKGITAYLRQAFAGQSVSTPAILYDPAELGQSGRPRWVAAHAHPIKGPDGRVREVMLIHDDVTARVQSEQALLASESRLKQLANTIPQLAWMADAEGWIHWYNERWYEYTGTTLEEMQGWGWQSVHDPAVLPEVMRQWKASIASGDPFQMTFPLRGKDGCFRPFFTLVAPLTDAAGNVVQWFGTNTDVSPLEEAKDELRLTEERLRLATEAGNIGIWEWDVANDKVIWSDRVYALHGVEPGRFGGRVADFTTLVHPGDLPTLWGKIEAAIAEQGGFSAEFRTMLPDGGVRWLSAWGRVHHVLGSAGPRMIGATISIDAYKKAEAQLKESDRRKDEFLAMLAHELRNPLAPISTAAQLLKLANNDANRFRQAGEIIARQVRHMTELVDDLLDVSRVTRGLIELVREDLDLKSAVASAIEQARPLLETRQHVLSTWMDARHIRVNGDRTRLVQAVSNLLTNAAKYTPPRGEIALRVETEGTHAVIRVKDNGVGIAADFLPHVFEIFSQAERTPDRAQGGLGIGLALVKSVIEQHGGTVTAHSEGPGKGSTFSLALQIQPERAADPDPEPQVPAAVDPVRIMIVDDNVDAAHSLAALLGARGHQVAVKESAEGALAPAPGDPPQLFILDIGLPDMSGYELAARLRQDPATAQAKLIALTGYGQPHDRERSKAAGFDHHLVKPVDDQHLQEVIARLCCVPLPGPGPA